VINHLKRTAQVLQIRYMLLNFPRSIKIPSQFNNSQPDPGFHRT